MKRLRLKADYPPLYKKGVNFFIIAESEFIGIKSYVLQTVDMKGKLFISEEELAKKFAEVYK